jgi:hypothetical protein
MMPSQVSFSVAYQSACGSASNSSSEIRSSGVGHSRPKVSPK